MCGIRSISLSKAKPYHQSRVFACVFALHMSDICDDITLGPLGVCSRLDRNIQIKIALSVEKVRIYIKIDLPRKNRSKLDLVCLYATECQC